MILVSRTTFLTDQVQAESMDLNIVLRNTSQAILAGTR